MATGQMSEVLRHLRRAVLLRDGAGLTDGRLLGEYLRRRDEAALAALVRRHGPMVWGVCRRVLRDWHDAEDAFQATFLVFVRRAASIASPELLANWLYGVAHQTALKARATAAKRKARERQVAWVPEPAAPERDLRHDVRPLLDQELSRLPDKYRVAIVLCGLEGKTRKEAARQLGVPDGTLAARLARGRALLAKRLARRGLTVSGAALAAVLAQNAAPASAPPAVVASTIKAAGLFAAGQAAAEVISGEVAALTQGVLKTMVLTKLKAATAVLVGVAGVLVLASSATLPLAPVRTAAAPVPEAKVKWREAFVLKHDHPVTAVACSAEWIAAGDAGGNVYLCDAKTGKGRRRAIVGGKSFTSVDRLQLQPDGKWLYAVFNGRKSMFQVDLQKAGLPAYGTGPANLGVSTGGEWWLDTKNPLVLTVRPNLNHLDEKPGRRHDIEDSARFKSEVIDAVFSPDAKGLAVLTADDQLRAFDWESRDLGKRPGGTAVVKQKVNAFGFSKDGKRLAVVGPGGFAKLYDSAKGKEVATLKGHRGAVHCVAFSPDGRTVATGGADLAVRFWDASTGNLLASLKGHEEAVRSVAFDPKGDTLITGSADKTVKIWKRAK